MRRALWAFLKIFIVWQIALRVLRKLYHFPAPAFIGRFLDSDHRRTLQPPDKLMRRSGIHQGMRVLELGCGSGAYTTFAGQAVRPTGRVYGLDIQPEMLRQIRKKLARPENRELAIDLIHGSAHQLPLADDSLDGAYVVTVLQEIPDQKRTLREVRRVLKPGGTLAVSEFLPDPDYSLRSTTVRIGEEAGFVLEQVAGNLWNYTVRFVNP